MYQNLKNTLLLLLAPALLACNSTPDEEKTIASTHPKLEKQLARDSVSMPITSNENPDRYERYRITMDEYENSGNYTVGNMYRGKLSPVDIGSHSDARTFRKALQDGMAGGVNFAGRYTVVTIGCGTACQQHFIVDRENGRIVEKIQGSMGAKYSPDSRIFVLNPPDSTINYNNCQDCEPQAYEMKDGKLHKLD